MLSNKSKSCVKVLVAIASAPPHKPVTVQALSDQVHLSVSNLESITRLLKDGGFIASTRGPGGGYGMACDPHTLTLWEVLQAVDDGLRQPLDVASMNPLIAELEQGFLQAFKDCMSSRTVGEFVTPGDGEQALFRPKSVGFRLSPMPQPLRPVGPNSVFELSNYPRRRAA
jgi:Rrf2 family protein